MNCPFCTLDKNDISNTIIEETKNFLIVPSKGSLCDGYLLILPKQHFISMNEMTNSQKDELLDLIKKYRIKFYNIYNKYPILFEHGSSKIQGSSASSVTHAHLHIVNHNFIDEKQIINDLNMKKVSLDIFFKYQNQSYISYISPKEELYISYDFKPTSQQMRIYIANDLGLTNKYNWRTSNFKNNIKKTIEKIK